MEEPVVLQPIVRKLRKCANCDNKTRNELCKECKPRILCAHEGCNRTFRGNVGLCKHHTPAAMERKRELAKQYRKK